MATQEQLDVIYNAQVKNQQTGLGKDAVMTTKENVSSSNGKLGDLYANPYSQKALYYPRDLGAMDKGHSVQFNIKDVNPTDIGAVVKKFGLDAMNGAISSSTKQYSEAKDFTSKAEVLANKTTAALGAAGSALVKTVQEMNMSTVTNIKTPTTQTKSVVRLYMPDTLNFGYNAQYDKLSVAEAINSVPIVGQISKAMTSFVSDNEMGKAILNKLGYTFNPQQQTLFEGIDFREFEMDFTFTPTSKDEAIIVQNIIKEFRRAAAPTKVSAAGGFFWVPPSIFDISFYFNGKHNYSIPPIRPCVLQSVNVNLAPNGWAAMQDGSPVQTTMSLSFRELDLVDRDSIVTELTLQNA